MRRARILVTVSLLAGSFGVGVAVAASLGVTSAKLTVSTYASSISPLTCDLNAANADSYVNQSSGSSNFGNATNLDVRSASSSANRRTLVQFNLSSCSIPANALVTAATLKLFMYTAPSASRTYEAHRVTAAWTETGVTWTNQPAVVAATTSTATTGTTANVSLTWNVATDVQAFLDGTANNGWRINDQTEGSATARLGQFRSAEYGTVSQRPILDITYYP